MKKLYLIPLVLLGFLLVGCELNTETEGTIDNLTEAELQALIEELLPEAEVSTTYDLASFSEAIQTMVDGVRTGIIGIVNTTSYGSGSGSGVVYKKEGNTYYVVTNEHVITDTIGLSIVFEKNGLLFEITNNYIEVLGYDVTTDLAVITFESDQEFAVIDLADSYELSLGEVVFAIGNPLGFDYYGTVTMGVISGLSRYVTSGDFNATLLQHDAAISPGNSGGALLNINGELVGINNMKIVDDEVTAIGFAIPSNTVRRIVNDLEDDGIITRPYLGISTIAQVNSCGLDYGVCVDVQPGGAAEAAGLENGDIIIGYMNDGVDHFIDILNFNDLREAILNSSVGEQIQIKYVRDGVEYISEPTTLNVHPDDQ